MISLSESSALRIWIIVLKKSQLWELAGWLSGSYSNSGRTRDYAMNMQTIKHCKNIEFKIFLKWLLVNSLDWSVDAECRAIGTLCFRWNAENKKDQMNNLFGVFKLLENPRLRNECANNQIVQWMHGSLFVVTSALEKHELCDKSSRIDWILS